MSGQRKSQRRIAAYAVVGLTLSLNGSVLGQTTSESDASEPRPRKSREGAVREFRVMAVASTRWLVSHDGTLWGGGLRVGDEPFRAIGWSLDALYERGEFSMPAGSFLVDTGTLGAALYYYHRWLPVTARIGAGLRLGLSRSAATDGAPWEGTSTVAPWGWPMAVALVSVRIDRSFVLELAGEGSYVVLPVVKGASGQRDVALRGAWVGAELGIGVLPSPPPTYEAARGSVPRLR